VFNQHTQSLAEAFGALFGLWGKNYEPSANPIACDYAATVGLACLERQGSRRSLEFINRPAILQLRDERGRTRQVVVEQLDGELAMIATPVGSQQVPFREIEEYWYGDFRVLWRIPEFMTGDGFYGDDSGQQLWIGARMMELAGGPGQAYGDDGPGALVSGKTRAHCGWYCRRHDHYPDEQRSGREYSSSGFVGDGQERVAYVVYSRCAPKIRSGAPTGQSA
jgi:hypothetical protein